MVRFDLADVTWGMVLMNMHGMNSQMIRPSRRESSGVSGRAAVSSPGALI